MSDICDFYLSSSEQHDFEIPRECRFLKRISSDTRDDFMLIKICPPLVGQIYGLGGEDIDVLLVAPRFKGTSLFPISEWPMYVYVARLLMDTTMIQDTIHDGEYELIAWAELYKTREDAERRQC